MTIATDQLNLEAQQLCSEALLLYHDNQLAPALSLFKQASGMYSRLAPSTDYYSIAAKICEIEYRLANFRQGIHFLEQVLQQFPIDHNTPDSIVEVYIELGNTHLGIEEFEPALVALKTGLALITQRYPHEAHLLSCRCYNGIGLAYVKVRQADLGIPYFERGLQMGIELWGLYHEYNSRSHGGLGFCWLMKKNYTKALHHAKSSLDISKHLEHRSLPALASDLNLQAICYGEMGDYDKALLCFEQAIQTAHEGFHNRPHPLTAKIYANMGEAMGKQGNTHEQISLYQEAAQILSEFYLSDNMIVAELEQKIGWWHANNAPQTQQAIPHFERAATIAQHLAHPQHPLAISSLNAIAHCQLLTHQHPAALTQLNHNLATIHATNTSEIHPEVAATYQLLSRTYADHQHYEQAAHYCQKALNSLIIGYTNTDICHTPAINNDNYHLGLDLLQVLQTKADVLTHWYHQSQHEPHLAVAFRTCQEVIKLLGALRRTYTQEGSKLLLGGNYAAIYEQGIELARLLYQGSQQNHYLDEAFSFAEKSRSLLLLGSLQDAEAKIRANIDPELLASERTMRSEMTYLDEQLYKEQLKGKDSPFLQILKKHRFEIAEQYEQLVNELEKNYPNYYQLKYDIDTLSVAALQQHLQQQYTDTHTNTIVVEYLVGKQHIYTFVIDQHTCQLHTLACPADLDDQISELSDAINALNHGEYIEYAQQLYQILLQPLHIELQQASTRLLIIPDGALYYLPFEALLTHAVARNTPYQQLPYLLQSCRVCYHYSVTLWLKSTLQSHRPPTAHDGFVGFAPIYAADQPLSRNLSEFEPSNTPLAVRSAHVYGKQYRELLYSETELQQIAQLFATQQQPTRLFLHSSATPDSFKHHSRHYRYVHIAAHGIINKEQPKLSGILLSPQMNNTEGMLYMDETYHTELNADLLVLSCCETGLGKIVPGEGMMAINRGFLYAGARNIIFTLFKVYDLESCLLTQYLFEHILAGNCYAQALAAAKRRLLQQNGVTPKSWAGFVLLGT